MALRDFLFGRALATTSIFKKIFGAGSVGQSATIFIGRKANKGFPLPSLTRADIIITYEFRKPYLVMYRDIIYISKFFVAVSAFYNNFQFNKFSKIY